MPFDISFDSKSACTTQYFVEHIDTSDGRRFPCLRTNTSRESEKRLSISLRSSRHGRRLNPLTPSTFQGLVGEAKPSLHCSEREPEKSAFKTRSQWGRVLLKLRRVHKSGGNSGHDIQSNSSPSDDKVLQTPCSDRICELESTIAELPADHLKHELDSLDLSNGVVEILDQSNLPKNSASLALTPHCGPFMPLKLTGDSDTVQATNSMVCGSNYHQPSSIIQPLPFLSVPLSPRPDTIRLSSIFMDAGGRSSSLIKESASLGHQPHPGSLEANEITQRLGHHYRDLDLGLEVPPSLLPTYSTRMTGSHLMILQLQFATQPSSYIDLSYQPFPVPRYHGDTTTAILTFAQEMKTLICANEAFPETFDVDKAGLVVYPICYVLAGESFKMYNRSYPKSNRIGEWAVQSGITSNHPAQSSLDLGRIETVDGSLCILGQPTQRHLKRIIHYCPAIESRYAKDGLFVNLWYLSTLGMLVRRERYGCQDYPQDPYCVPVNRTILTALGNLVEFIAFKEVFKNALKLVDSPDDEKKITTIAELQKHLIDMVLKLHLECKKEGGDMVRSAASTTICLRLFGVIAEFCSDAASMSVSDSKLGKRGWEDCCLGLGELFQEMRDHSPSTLALSRREDAEVSSHSATDLQYPSPSVSSASSSMSYNESVVAMSRARTASTHSPPDCSSSASGSSAFSEQGLFVILMCPLCNDAILVTKQLLEKGSDVIRWHLYINHPRAASRDGAHILGPFSPNSSSFISFMQSVSSQNRSGHTVIEYKSFCPRCWEMFSMAPGEQTQLAKRIHRHLKETAKCLPSTPRWACQECKGRFRRRDILKRHQQRFKGACRHRGGGRLH